MSQLTFNKTRLGLAPFDHAFGGIYFNRPTLVWGSRDTGKSLLSAQFVAKVLQTGERVGILADDNPDGFFIDLQSLCVDVNKVVTSGQLIALSCKGFAGATATGALPFPAAVEELRGLVQAKSLGFAIFNTVVPWVAVSPDELEARIETFVSATEALGVTSLLTLPRPVSPTAVHLRDLLAVRCPVVIRMDADRSGNRSVCVERYRGATDVSLPADYPVAIVPNRGFVSPDDTGGKSSADFSMPPAAAAARQRQPRHHSLIAPTGQIGADRPTTPSAPTSSGPAIHPRHPQHHHSLLDPTALGASRAPAPTPAPPPELDPPSLQTAEKGTPPAPEPPTPPASPRRHRFSSVIQ